jgi:23S rRNA (adenine2503-C2)-methyltransferase
MNKEKQFIRIKDLDRDELEALVVGLSEKPFHGRQIFAALHRRNVRSIDEMTDLPSKLRQKLRFCEPVDLVEPISSRRAPDGTTKALLGLRDGERIESVWMPEEDYAAACLSTQVGCPLECTFCATGRLGFKRNLTAGEIVDQVIFFRRKFTEPPLRNLVFMGMGEPLLNYDNLTKAIRILSATDGAAFAQRRMTISTAGIVPGIRKLAMEGLKVKLAVSLNAPTDELRSEIMPINRRYPIKELLDAVIYFHRNNGNKITFEYTLMPDVNDTEVMIRSLRKLLLQVPSKLNLIPLNPVRKSPRRAEDWDAVFNRFYRILADDPITLTLRRSRGAEIQAACGQLAARYRAVRSSAKRRES